MYEYHSHHYGCLMFVSKSTLQYKPAPGETPLFKTRENIAPARCLGSASSEESFSSGNLMADKSIGISQR